MRRPTGSTVQPGGYSVFDLTHSESRVLELHREGMTHRQISAETGFNCSSVGNLVTTATDKSRLAILSKKEGRKSGFTELEQARHADSDRRATRPTGQIGKP